MPIKVQGDLPAKAVIERENIFIMDEGRANSQDIRPLQVLVLNLMPLKEDYEIQLIRSLSNTPLQVNLTWAYTASHESKNTAVSHLNQFYTTYAQFKNRYFDGMIISGAPVEHMEFEEVGYWEELTQIMEWTKTHVTSTLHICWGAQAGLYYHYGIKKRLLPEKLFGVYKHKVLHRKVPIVRGFDDVFLVPHSRHTASDDEAIWKHPNLMVEAVSNRAGIFLVTAQGGKQIFITGHPEYDRMTLNQEYHRDLDKGLPIQKPYNYYPDNDITQRPNLTWRAHANTLYANWLNYYVYQETPYEWGVVKKNS